MKGATPLLGLGSGYTIHRCVTGFGIFRSPQIFSSTTTISRFRGHRIWPLGPMEQSGQAPCTLQDLGNPPSPHEPSPAKEQTRSNLQACPPPRKHLSSSTPNRMQRPPALPGSLLLPGWVVTPGICPTPRPLLLLPFP